jgi:hypothetical protein
VRKRDGETFDSNFCEPCREHGPDRRYPYGRASRGRAASKAPWAGCVSGQVMAHRA